MEEPSEDTIMEEREELMVSPFGGDPTLRTAHFLKPTVHSMEIANIPSSLSSPPSSQTTIWDIRKTPLKVNFRGRRHPQKRWETWVDRLIPKYHHIWEKAGILESILASTKQTLMHNDLIFGLAERWCVETNTFVFPWGESTLTLEDMMVLGGYSVLGDSVSSPLKTKELIEIKEGLSKAYGDIRSGKARFASHYAWMEHFMEQSDGELEHQAFLVSWLSRYVFPMTVSKHVFPTAIHLSRGTQIALAPAVLATIYRDLSLLKKSIMGYLKSWDCNRESNGFTIKLWAPFQLVQLWAWERFPSLRPNPNVIKVGDPRSARWHRLPKQRTMDVRKAMDSEGEFFQWRPYATVVNNWEFSKFYREKEEWVLVESGMDKEVESLALCLRASELVGLDCIEQYLPHRVAMQFGFDQDVPVHVSRYNKSLEAAWRNYTRPIGDSKLYIPPRLFESDVTNRYFSWRNRSVLAKEDAIKAIVRQPRSKTYTRLPRAIWGNMEDNQVFDLLGFPSKHKRVEAEFCVEVDEDKLAISELLRQYLRQINVEDHDKPLPTVVFQSPPSSSASDNGAFKKREVIMEPIEMRQNSVEDDDKPLSTIVFQSPPSSSALDNGAFKKMETTMEHIEMSLLHGKAMLVRPETKVEDETMTKPNSPLVSINNIEGEISIYGMVENLGLDLEARIAELEKLVAPLKAAKFG